MTEQHSTKAALIPALQPVVTDLPGVSVLTDRSVASLHRDIAAGRFGPKAIRMNGSRKYLVAEIVAWLNSPRHDGTLHDSQSWPLVWQALRAAAQKGGAR